MSWLEKFRAGSRRRRAREAAHWWIRELDVVEEDWDTTGILWEFIATWINADPVNCQEFLALFRLHHAQNRASSSVPVEMAGPGGASLIFRARP